MRFTTAAILSFLASLPLGGAAPALMDDDCPAVPILHHSVDAEISECTAAIGAGVHNISSAGRGYFFARSRQLPEVRAQGYLDRGLLYHFMGKTDLAIADYTSAIGWRNDFADAREARGDAYEDLGQQEKADSDYQTATRMAGADHAFRCWVRAVRGHPLDRALTDCNKALKANPGDKDILQSRCFVYYRMGSYSAALADCDAAEKSHPRYSDALYVGGLSKLRLGDKAGGNADIAAALDADYRIAETYSLYGVTREEVSESKSK
jgi:tetratricopeptide (TPR) repeat protein